MESGPATSNSFVAMHLRYDLCLRPVYEVFETNVHKPDYVPIPFCIDTQPCWVLKPDGTFQNAVVRDRLLWKYGYWKPSPFLPLVTSTWIYHNTIST